MARVLEVLRNELAAQRAAGADFATAWPDVVDQAVAHERDAPERKAWRAALAATEGAWHDAFDGTAPTRHQAALRMIAVDGERVPVVAGEGDGRTCAQCRTPLAPGKKRTARFCSDPCRRTHHERRAAA